MEQVRSVDIAFSMNFSKPSVSNALKKLRSDGLVSIDSGGFITLTVVGKKIAGSIYERHVLISNWLISLGVDNQVALNDACKMEHVVSAQSFEAIKRHIVNCRCS